MGYNGCLSLRKLGKSVKVQNLPSPFLRGQPLKDSCLRKKSGKLKASQLFVQRFVNFRARHRHHFVIPLVRGRTGARNFPELCSFFKRTKQIAGSRYEMSLLNICVSVHSIQYSMYFDFYQHVRRYLVSNCGLL